LVIVLLLPAFFAFTGLRTQIGLVHGVGEWTICALIIAVASVGKFGGASIAAVDNSAPASTHPEPTYKSGKLFIQPGPLLSCRFDRQLFLAERLNSWPPFIYLR
jgi:hypothetical protein